MALVGWELWCGYGPLSNRLFRIRLAYLRGDATALPFQRPCSSGL